MKRTTEWNNTWIKQYVTAEEGGKTKKEGRKEGGENGPLERLRSRWAASLHRMRCLILLRILHEIYCFNTKTHTPGNGFLRYILVADDCFYFFSRRFCNFVVVIRLLSFIFVGINWDDEELRLLIALGVSGTLARLCVCFFCPFSCLSAVLSSALVDSKGRQRQCTEASMEWKIGSIFFNVKIGLDLKIERKSR